MKKNTTPTEYIFPHGLILLFLTLLAFCLSTCTVEIPLEPAVQIVKMQSVQIQVEKNELKIGETMQISKVITPADTTNPTLYFEIKESNPLQIADIDLNTGILKPKGNGKITVLARNTNPASDSTTTDKIVSNELEITISGFINTIELTVEGTVQETPVFSTPEEKKQLILSITPTVVGDPFKEVLLFSSPENAVRISESGLVSSISSETLVTVTAISRDDPSKTASVNFQVNEMSIPLESVQYNVPNKEIAINTIRGGQTITMTKHPPLSTAGLTWSIIPKDSKVIKIESSNEALGSNNFPTISISAQINGKVKLKVVATDDGTVSDEIEITVTNQVEPTSIVLSRKQDKLDVTAPLGGGDIDLSTIFDVKILPLNAAANAVTWEIIGEQTIATDTGTFTPVSAGIVQVKVVSALLKSIVSNALDFTIVPQVFPVGIGLKRKSEHVNTTIDIQVRHIDLNTVFDITVLPNNTSNKSVVWKLEEGAFATITPEGILIPSKIETVNVFLESVSKRSIVSKPVPFNIVQIPVTKIILTRIKGTEDIKGMIDEDTNMKNIFKINIEPLNATYKTVHWLVSGKATITKDGVLKSLDQGEVQISVTSTADPTISSAPVTFTIGPLLATSITLVRKQGQEKKFGIAGGATIILNDVFDIRFEPQKTSDKSVTWSLITTTMASITPEGILTPIQLGTVNVVATSTAANTVSSRQHLLEIRAAPTTVVSSIELRIKPDNNISISAGDGAVDMNTIFDVIVSPNDATYKDVLWSLTGNAATINVSGLLTPLTGGQIQLIVTSASNDKIKSMPVNFDIIGIPVKSITLERKVGQSETKAYLRNPDVDLKDVFNLTIDPINSSEVDFVWSITEGSEFATITNAGVLTPIKVGEVKVVVTATQSKVSSEPKPFSVDIIPITSISLTKKIGVGMILINENEDFDLNTVFDITVTPSNASEIPVWKSFMASTADASHTLNPVSPMGMVNSEGSTGETIGSMFVYLSPPNDDKIKSEEIPISFKRKSDQFGGSKTKWERYVFNDERLPDAYKSEKFAKIVQKLIDDSVLTPRTDGQYQVRLFNNFLRADVRVNYILINSTKSTTSDNIRIKVLYEYNDGHLIIKPDGYLAESAPQNSVIIGQLKPLTDVMYNEKGWDVSTIGRVEHLGQSTSSSWLFLFQSREDPEIFFNMW